MVININGDDFPVPEEVFNLMLEISKEKDRYLRALQHINYNVDEVSQDYPKVDTNPIESN